MTDDPSHTANLLFPTASIPVSKTLSAISKSNLSITNRLHSIVADAAFVTSVANTIDVPVIANERCGSWYVSPQLKKGSAYFKSTDGHHGQWGFSLRRLNLEALRLAGEAGGCIIVDSTRRGKPLPDALSKTIPIWCAVFNRLLFPGLHDTHHVEVLPDIISDSEAAQIDARLAACVEGVRSLDLDLDELGQQMPKPLKPCWIARSLGLLAPTLQEQLDIQKRFTPVYLVMASLHHDHDSIGRNEAYVQGAGDDIENWGCGLESSVFWAHQQELLAAGEDEILDIIAGLIEAKAPAEEGATWHQIRQAPWLSIGTMNALQDDSRHEGLILCLASVPSPEDTAKSNPKIRHFRCRPGKLGSKDLRKLLPAIIELVAHSGAAHAVRVCCETGTDLSVGVALAILCQASDESGRRNASSKPAQVMDKILIRKKLSWIIASIPSASPSRATLNAVNDFLMGPQSARSDRFV